MSNSKIFYSPSTNKFYDLQLNYSYLPDDLIMVSKKDFLLVLTAREEQKPFEFTGGRLRIYNAKPSEFFNWDHVSKQWILDCEAKQKIDEKINLHKKRSLLKESDEKIDLLQDELELGLSDHSEQTLDLLKRWKIYRVYLSKVDSSDPVWPEAPK